MFFMKILIIGSEGFVGKNLVKGLSEKHDVYTSDQLDSSAHQNYSQCDIALQGMKADFFPNGQYADFEIDFNMNLN